MSDLHPLLSMVEPTSADYDRALVVLLWRARQLLADAERCSLTQGPRRLGGATPPSAVSAKASLKNALVTLRSAASLLYSGEAVPRPDLAPVAGDLHNAILAAEAACARVKLYVNAAAEAQDGAIARAHTDHMRAIWRRGSEEARKNAHRALSHLLPLVPHAWEKEEGHE